MRESAFFQWTIIIFEKCECSHHHTDTLRTLFNEYSIDEQFVKVWFFLALFDMCVSRMEVSSSVHLMKIRHCTIRNDDIGQKQQTHNQMHSFDSVVVVVFFGAHFSLEIQRVYFSGLLVSLALPFLCYFYLFYFSFFSSFIFKHFVCLSQFVCVTTTLKLWVYLLVDFVVCLVAVFFSFLFAISIPLGQCKLR